MKRANSDDKPGTKSQKLTMNTSYVSLAGGFRLGIWEPPFSRNNFARLSSVRLPGAWGYIVMIAPDDERFSVREMAAVLPTVRLDHQSAPFVLKLPSTLTPAHAHLIRSCDRLRFRAFCCEHEDMVAAIRAQITAPIDLTSDLTEWLTLHWNTPPDGLLADLQRHLAPLADSVSQEFCETHKSGNRRLSKHLAQANLPSLRVWAALLRAMRCALTLQSKPSNEIARTAFMCGYGDQASLCHAFKRFFLATPRQVQQVLGWEPLVSRVVFRRGGANAKRLLGRTECGVDLSQDVL